MSKKCKSLPNVLALVGDGFWRENIMTNFVLRAERFQDVSTRSAEGICSSTVPHHKDFAFVHCGLLGCDVV